MKSRPHVRRVTPYENGSHHERRLERHVAINRRICSQIGGIPLLILIIGLIVATLIPKVVDKVLERVGSDRALERGGVFSPGSSQSFPSPTTSLRPMVNARNRAARARTSSAAAASKVAA